MKKSALLLLSLFACFALAAQKKPSKKKDDKKEKDKPKGVDYVLQEGPVADTATKFIGIIKYRITTDDPSDKDSMFIVFGEDKMRFIMFYPGYKEGDIFQDNMIANFKDSSFIVMDNRAMTYKTEKVGDRNSGTVFTLNNFKKTGLILKYTCQEYSGEMTTKEGDSFEVAALLSKQHSYISVPDYNFLNIQPAVIGYKIVLGYRTKSSENENTYIIAYKIEPGNVDSYFDLAGFKAK
ncbi:MAG: hypothetical protein ABIT05_16060 [Chitinophagaceae bacterium]